jgi:hypothetical protein
MNKLSHPFWKRVDHFFHYYKAHIIVGLISLFILMSLIYSIVDNRQQADLPPADVSIVFFGDYSELDLTTFEKRILAKFPEWQHVNIELTYVPGETKNAYDAAEQQKSVLTLMDDEFDIFIMDSENFHKLQGLYQPLDQIEDALINRLDSDQLVYAKAEGESKKHLYGVDITNSDIFEDVNFASTEKIATIRTNAKNFENAIKWIKEIK